MWDSASSNVLPLYFIVLKVVCSVNEEYRFGSGNLYYSMAVTDVMMCDLMNKVEKAEMIRQRT